MNNIKSKQNIEKRYNIWIYIAILYISYFGANFLRSEIAIYSAINYINMFLSTLGQHAPYSMVIILRIIMPAINVAIFELFSRIFYGICNAFSFGSITMSGKDFVSALRVFVILINIVLGVFNLLYYFFNFLIPLGLILMHFIVTTSGYLLFFIYINKHYLDKKTAHRAFRIMAILYMLYALFNIVMGGFIF